MLRRIQALVLVLVVAGRPFHLRLLKGPVLPLRHGVEEAEPENLVEPREVRSVAEG
jgi:hypothetical protein